jgi:hypothetical protein
MHQDLLASLFASPVKNKPQATREKKVEKRKKKNKVHKTCKCRASIQKAAPRENWPLQSHDPNQHSGATRSIDFSELLFSQLEFRFPNPVFTLFHRQPAAL